MQNFYFENYKPLLKDIKEELKKKNWKTFHVPGLKDLTLLKW